MKLKKFALAGAAALAMLGAATSSSAAAPKFAPWGVDLTAADTAIKPGDDFWAYVNGGWDQRTQIDPQRTFAGIDSVLNDQIDVDVRSIIEDMAKDPTANGQIGQQIGDFYASWMDEGAVEAGGTAPLNPYLDRIAAAKTRTDLVDLFATVGFSAPIAVGISPDPKDPAHYAVGVDQAGLGLPTRDYYLLPD